MTLVLLAAIVLLGAEPDRTALLKAPFDSMEKAIKDGDEKLFKAQWHADGYAKNLVGGSGIPGADVFKQGTRKKWFPRPDFARAQVLGDGAAVIVPCEKAVDKVLFLLVRTEVTVDGKKKPAYIVLGGGEKREEVAALANRWLKKEPLEPPKDAPKDEGKD